MGTSITIREHLATHLFPDEYGSCVIFNVVSECMLQEKLAMCQLFCELRSCVNKQTGFCKAYQVTVGVCLIWACISNKYFVLC